MAKYLLTDCDGVILDFDEAFNRYAKRVGMPEKPEGKHTNKVYGWTKADQLRWFDERAMAPEFSDMKPIAKSYKAINSLFWDGYDIIVITNWSNPGRYKNLKNEFGDAILAVHLNGMGNSKSEILKRFPPSIWVEDDPRKAIEGLEFGHTCFLIKNAYNLGQCEDSRVIVVNDWLEILEWVKNNDDIHT